MFSSLRTRAPRLLATLAFSTSLTLVAAASAQVSLPPLPPPSQLSPQPVHANGAAPATSATQAQPPEPPGYREAIQQALIELENDNYEEARARFWRAHTLLPNARTLRGLGIAEFSLRNYDACIHHLEASLASRVYPLDEGLRADAKQLLARANDFVARYTLDTKPRASRILLDGVARDVPESAPLVLQVGDHVIEVHTPGYQPERVRLSVKGGETETLTVLFTKPVEAEPRPQPSARRLRKNPWLWSAVGLVVAGAATGTAIALSRDKTERAEPYLGTTGVGLKAP